MKCVISGINPHLPHLSSLLANLLITLLATQCDTAGRRHTVTHQSSGWPVDVVYCSVTMLMMLAGLVHSRRWQRHNWWEASAQLLHN